MQDRVSHATALLREALAILSDLHPASKEVMRPGLLPSDETPSLVSYTPTREEADQQDKEAFGEWLRAEMKARFPEADSIQQNGINNLYQKTGGDTSLVSDLFDIAQKMNETRQKVYRPFGLMVSTLNKMSHADIREEASQWRAKKANKKETITERVLRKTLEDVGPGKGRQQIDAILARKEQADAEEAV